MDTDSFVYYIKTHDFYQDIFSDIPQWFDTSCYSNPKASMPANMNKKVPGYFKDETGDREISHFVALRPKMYAFYTNNDKSDTIKHIKGIKKCIQENEITFDDLYQVLVTNVSQSRGITRFHHKNHTIYTIQESKVALDSNDNKRVILNDHISTLSYGHWRLSSN